MSDMLNFARNVASPDGAAESVRVIPLDISEIECSRFNPRTSRGVHYESTKESIRNTGLQNMLTVTKRPGDEHYSLYYGGNTRLTILKELVNEALASGDEDTANRLRLQQCRFVPYTDDLDVLVKHMAENEERSGMTLIDKARAVFQIREMYLQQKQVESVSQRDLVSFIHGLGWTRVNQPIMTELSFAYHELQDVIPLALAAGMGRPKINQLRLWLRDIEQFVTWLEEKGVLQRTVQRNGEEVYETYNAAQARALYFTVLAEFDTDLSNDDPAMPEDVTVINRVSEDDEESGNNRLIDLGSFFEQYRYRLADILMQYDPGLNSARIHFEVEQIRKTGKVGEEVPMEELWRQAQQTSNMPPANFPTPRKPRESKTGGEEEPLSGESESTESGFENSTAPSGEEAAAPVLAEEDNTVTAAKPDGTLTMLSERYPNRVQMPFGPPVQLPDKKLPWDRYNESIGQECKKRLRYLLDNYDTGGLLHELIRLDGDAAETPTLVNAPYFYLTLDNGEQFERMERLLTEGSEHERYAALYCLHLWLFYLEQVFHAETNDQLSESERATYDNLRLLWQEYAHHFADCQLQCRIGLLYRRGKDAINRFNLIDKIIIEYQLLLWAIETRPIDPPEGT